MKTQYLAFLSLGLIQLVETARTITKPERYGRTSDLTFSALSIDYKGPNKLDKAHFAKFLAKNNSSGIKNPDIFSVLVLNRFSSWVKASLALRFAIGNTYYKPEALIPGYTLIDNSKYGNTELFVFKSLSCTHHLSEIETTHGLIPVARQLLDNIGAPTITFTVNKNFTIRIVGIKLFELRTYFSTRQREMGLFHRHLQSLPKVHQQFILGNFNFGTVVEEEDNSDIARGLTYYYLNYWEAKERRIKDKDLKLFLSKYPKFKNTTLPTSEFRDYSSEVNRVDQLRLLMPLEYPTSSYTEEPIKFQPTSGLDINMKKYSEKKIPSYNNRALTSSSSSAVRTHMDIKTYDVIDFDFLKNENLSILLSGSFNLDAFSKGESIRNKLRKFKFAKMTLEIFDYFDFYSYTEWYLTASFEIKIKVKNQDTKKSKTVMKVKKFSGSDFLIPMEEIVKGFNREKSWIEFKIQVKPFTKRGDPLDQQTARVYLYIDEESLEPNKCVEGKIMNRLYFERTLGHIKLILNN